MSATYCSESSRTKIMETIAWSFKALSDLSAENDSYNFYFPDIADRFSLPNSIFS